MMSPTERILTALADRKCDPKRNGKGWSARCPAHEDRRPSLSVSEGDDGRALVRCHAGCTVDAICDAVGLRVADLMNDDGVDVDTTRRPQRKKRVASTSKLGNTYPRARDAVAALDRTMAKDKGQRVAQWTYHDASGDPVAVVCRYDLPTPEGEKQRKTFRPVARRGDRWTIGGMPVPRPLYCLADLAGADRVFITEGEKAADAARAIGLAATTSAHGSQCPDKTDWSPLAGRECGILPDNDDPGRKYADTVAAILAKLTPTPVVKLVELPGLPGHGDIANWVDARPDTDAGELRRQVEALADEADAIQPDRLAARIERFQPFPTDTLPEPIRGFVEASAKAIGCDASYLALPMLTALAAAIGNTRRIQLKRGWTEPAILWTAIVGDSGTMKSPALELVLQPIRDRQSKALAEYTERMKDYRDDLLRYERDLAGWKKSKGGDDDPPEKPEEPVADRYWCDDPTIEALAVLLLNQWRGLLMARDELAGWIGGFDRYSQGKGVDIARWLEMFGGRSMVVDRKTGTPRMLFVPRAAMSVAGAIQPEILRRCLGQQYRENGLAARLLLTCPPRTPKKWTEADIDPRKGSEIAEVLDRLYSLQPATGDDGEPRPITIGLTPEAKTAWVKFYNEHAQEHAELSGDLSATWSKLEGYAARFALVIQYSRWAANAPDLATPDAVDLLSIEAGIRLSRWFGREARRIYSILDESDEGRERRRLVELIQRKGGSVTARDLMRSSRIWATANDAEAVLDDLAAAKYGRWAEQPTSSKGGRPTRVFVLADNADVDTTPTKPSETGGCVNVNGVNGPDDDWGEL